MLNYPTNPYMQAAKKPDAPAPPSRFVGEPDEMVVDGKIFVNGEWISLEEYRKKQKQSK